MSLLGLPAAGYSASARWHVFMFQLSALRFRLSIQFSAFSFQVFEQQFNRFVRGSQNGFAGI